MDKLLIYTDGGCRKTNPGPAACAYYVPSLDYYHGKLLGIKTNNEAEYSGLILALEWAVETGRKHIHVVSDSELMVLQMNGRHKCQSEKLMPLRALAKVLTTDLDSFSIEHRLRGFNKEADAYYNKIMDEAGY